MPDIAFTTSTRQALTHARDTAQQRHQGPITPIDLLHGLASTPGTAQLVLAHHSITPESILNTPPPALHSDHRRTPLDTRTTAALEQAAETALDRNDTTIDTDLILDALLDQADIIDLLQHHNTTPKTSATPSTPPAKTPPHTTRPPQANTA